MAASRTGHMDGHTVSGCWMHRCGNRGGHAGQRRGKTDSSHSIKQRANNKCVRDGCAAAINVKSIISQPHQSRSARAGCYDGEECVSLLTSSSFSIRGKSCLKLICEQMGGEGTQLQTCIRLWSSDPPKNKQTQHITPLKTRLHDNITQ